MRKLTQEERQVCEYLKKAQSIRLTVNEGRANELQLKFQKPGDDINTLLHHIGIAIQDYFMRH